MYSNYRRITLLEYVSKVTSLLLAEDDLLPLSEVDFQHATQFKNEALWSVHVLVLTFWSKAMGSNQKNKAMEIRFLSRVFGLALYDGKRSSLI